MIATQTAVDVFSCDDTLVEVGRDSSGLEIVVPITVDLASCLKESVVTVSVEIIKRSDRIVGTQNTIDQINAHLKSTAKNRDTSSKDEKIIAARDVDITVLMPNSVVAGRSYSRMSLSEISRLFQPKSKLVPSQSERVSVQEDVSSPTDRQIVGQLRDPGAAVSGYFPADTIASISSTVPPAGTRVEAVPVVVPSSKIVQESTSRVSVRASLKYAGDAQDLLGTQVRVTAKSVQGDVQVTLLRASLGDLIVRSKIPTLPPVVTGNFNSYGRASIVIKQQDEIADRVTIAIRPIKDYNSPSVGFSTIKDRVLCRRGQTAVVQIDVAEPSIVRVHPALEESVSPVFGSVVLGKKQAGLGLASDGTRSSLVAINSAKGISLDFLTNDMRASAVLLRRRDLQTGEVSCLTKGPVPSTSVRGLVDEGVEDLTRIQYAADLYRSNGDVVGSAATSEPVVRVDPRGIVAAEVTATPTAAGNQTVRIDIKSTIQPNDVNFLIDYVKGIGLEAAFQADLETLRKSLLNCVKFDVTRFDLQTGEAKFVGQTSDTIVDDIDDVKITSNFLYFCEAFVRSPSQLTDVISDRANRPTGINPQITRLGLHITKADVDGTRQTSGVLSDARRFFSRSNFETGTMPASPAGDGFRDGKTGDVFSARVTVNPVLPTVTSVQVRKTGIHPVVSWNMTGDARMVERFDIMGQSSGATWKVASAGFTGTAVTLQITDNTSYTLPRYVTYSVYPVYLDGKFGEPSVSSPVLLEKVRKI